MKLFKKILRGFFYIYGTIGLPIAYLLYDWYWSVRMYHKHSFLLLPFQSKMRISCSYLTFFINFPLFFVPMFIVGEPFLISEKHILCFVGFTFMLMFLWDYFCVVKFFRWLFEDDYEDQKDSLI